MLISAFAFDGVPQRVLDHIIQTADIYVSPSVLEEYREVPGELFSARKITPSQRLALVAGMASFVAGAKLVVPKSPITICRDPEDNMLLECCLAARADLLVTGDKDLLDIDPEALRQVRLGKLRVITPRKYLDLIAS